MIKVDGVDLRCSRVIALLGRMPGRYVAVNVDGRACVAFIRSSLEAVGMKVP